VLEVGVGEHDRRVDPAQLERDAREARRGQRATRRLGAGEVQRADALVARQRSRNLGTAGQQRQHVPPTPAARPPR